MLWPFCHNDLSRAAKGIILKRPLHEWTFFKYVIFSNNLDKSFPSNYLLISFAESLLVGLSNKTDIFLLLFLLICELCNGLQNEKKKHRTDCSLPFWEMKFCEKLTKHFFLLHESLLFTNHPTSGHEIALRHSSIFLKINIVTFT